MVNPFSIASVMVVEDDPVSQQMVARLLEGIGVGETVTANNGAHALEMLAAREKDLDLVICDVSMPEMDGYEFVRRLRYGAAPTFKNVPVLILTAKDSERNVQHARILKIDGFFVKPPSKEVLEKAIRRIIADRIRDTLDVG
jgi:CheY-like chemotaxis protein